MEDVIEFQDKKNKSKGYKLVDGDPVAGIKITLEDTLERPKYPITELLHGNEAISDD